MRICWLRELSSYPAFQRMPMTLTQQSAPYAHWDFVHPSSGDRLRIIPERGGLVSGWCCGGREVLYFDQERYSCLLYTSPSPRDA